uniref:Zinc finger FYVE domain-containing protein 1 n=1 Tax=Hirondellea gigas TaxID=1518452 RepID=A0A6A7FVX9_9CRUS
MTSKDLKKVNKNKDECTNTPKDDNQRGVQNSHGDITPSSSSPEVQRQSANLDDCVSATVAEPMTCPGNQTWFTQYQDGASITSSSPKQQQQQSSYLPSGHFSVSSSAVSAGNMAGINGARSEPVSVPGSVQSELDFELTPEDPPQIGAYQDLSGPLRSMSLGRRERRSSAIMDSIETPLQGSHSYNSGYVINAGGLSDHLSSISLHPATRRPCMLLDKNENLRVEDPVYFVKRMGLDNSNIDTPLKVLTVVGNIGEGKSHVLNQLFFDGREVFPTSNNSVRQCSTEDITESIGAVSGTITKGVLVLDTEGKTSNSVQNVYTNRIIYKAMAVSDIILYRCRSERLQPDMYEFLSHFARMYHSIFKSDIQKLMPGSDNFYSNSPSLVIFHDTRNTELFTTGEKGTPSEQIMAEGKRLGFPLHGFSKIMYVGSQASTLHRYRNDSTEAYSMYGGSGTAGTSPAGGGVSTLLHSTAMTGSVFGSADRGINSAGVTDNRRTTSTYSRAAQGCARGGDVADVQFEELVDVVHLEIENNSRRIPRPILEVMDMLQVFTEKYSQKIEHYKQSFPEYLFTCQETCLVCSTQCLRPMMHNCRRANNAEDLGSQNIEKTHNKSNIGCASACVSACPATNNNVSRMSSKSRRDVSIYNDFNSNASSLVATRPLGTNSHRSDERCKFSEHFSNKQIFCAACLARGKSNHVIDRPYEAKEGLIKGMMNYAISGSVLECPDCQVIFRSRSNLLYTSTPDETVIVEAYSHVWSREHHVGYSQNTHSGRQALETVTALQSSVTGLTANLPVTGLSSWLNNFINPPYWKLDSLCTHCDQCNTPLAAIHHCRKCGLGFCNDCSRNKAYVPEKGWGDQTVRVCDSCYRSANSHPADPDSSEAAESNVTARQVSEMCRSLISAASSTAAGLIKASTRPTYWIPDEDIHSCKVCAVKFDDATVLHHCRACGHGVCDKCSPHRLPVKERGWDDDVRVCKTCFSLRMSVEYQDT